MAAKRTNKRSRKTARRAGSELAPAGGSAAAFAIHLINQLEEALQSAVKLARSAHIAAMRASEELGRKHETGAAHACLALMECSVRALNQANDAARYSRHSLRYPPNGVFSHAVTDEANEKTQS